MSKTNTKQNENIIFFGLLVIISIVLILGTTAQAADTGTVTATVTAQNVAVSVADGTVTYGTLSLSGTASTTAAGSGLDDSQTATNDGNVASTFNIKSQDSANWTLAGAIGSDDYVQEFCITDCETTPTWTALTTSYQELAAGVAAAGTQDFDLKIIVPSSSSNYTSQSVDVTVQVVAD